MKKYGYARVSSRNQNPERQLKVMEEQGISSAAFHRRVKERYLAEIKP